LNANIAPDPNYAPDLEIQQSGGKIIISWANSAKGWQLEGSDAVAAVVRWEVISNAPVVADGRFVVVHEAKQGRWFYRLRRP
jgi:hypothetical protein